MYPKLLSERLDNVSVIISIYDPLMTNGRRYGYDTDRNVCSGTADVKGETERC